MPRRHPVLTDAKFRSKTPATPVEDVITTKELPRLIEDFLIDGQLRLHTPKTTETRRDFFKKFCWFMETKGIEVVGAREIKAFMHYLNTGHEDAGGRWGNPRMKKPLKPVSIQSYYRDLRTFFGWLATEDILSVNLMLKVRPPIVRLQQKPPLSPEHVTSLLQAARRSSHPRRDEALVLMLLDTGLRASEISSLKKVDVDFAGQSLTVCGKGNKTRTVFFGRVVKKALSAYLRSRSRIEPTSPLFASRTGDPLNRNSLLQLIRRLTGAAGIPASQCSPHGLRRTFAVSFLRNGGNIFALQSILAHTDLQMCKRYVAVSDADAEATHRRCSPADRLKS